MNRIKHIAAGMACLLAFNGASVAQALAETSVIRGSFNPGSVTPTGGSCAPMMEVTEVFENGCLIGYQWTPVEGTYPPGCPPVKGGFESYRPPCDTDTPSQIPGEPIDILPVECPPGTSDDGNGNCIPDIRNPNGSGNVGGTTDPVIRGPGGNGSSGGSGGMVCRSGDRLFSFCILPGGEPQNVRSYCAKAPKPC